MMRPGEGLLLAFSTVVSFNTAATLSFCYQLEPALSLSFHTALSTIFLLQPCSAHLYRKGKLDSTSLNPLAFVDFLDCLFSTQIADYYIRVPSPCTLQICKRQKKPHIPRSPPSSFRFETNNLLVKGSCSYYYFLSIKENRNFFFTFKKQKQRYFLAHDFSHHDLLV